MVTFDVVLADVEQVAIMGGSGSEFIAAAFVSWYRPGDSRKRSKVNLYNYSRLDAQRRRLFFHMLQLRDMPGWDDEELFRVEQVIKKYWGWR